MLNEACPIWGEVAAVQDGMSLGWSVSGHRTDGAYRIASSVIEETRSLPVTDKAKLTTWIVDQHRAGTLEPMINSEVLEHVAGRRSLTYRERVDRYFLMLRAHDRGLGRSIRLFGNQDATTAKWKGIASAWLEVGEAGELSALVQALKDADLLRDDQSDSLTLSAKGLERLDTLEFAGADSSQGFVAMWFSPTMDAAYRDGFETAIVDNGYRALRIDQKEHINKIDDEIIAEIRRSRFVVADFTCELVEQGDQSSAIPRGGVYFEAGFAQGLGIPVIWTVREDCIEHVHFDTRQYAHIVWSDPADLRAKLRNRIGAVIGARGAA